jgi:Fe-S-cluster formation regulator IscX/YfhJ
MYIKKFYDIEATEPVASNETTSEAPVESIAAIMARQGVKSGLSEEVAMPPRVNNGASKASSVKDDSPVEPTKEESKSEKVEKASAREEAEVPEPQKEKEQKAESSWQETIKSQQPDEVLKALGFDEKAISFINELKDVDPKMVNFLNSWKSGIDVKEYFNELSKDFATMPAEDVMRHQLRLDYPKATEAQLEILYKKEVADKYNLNSYDEDEQNEGKLLLEAKADKYRDELVRMQEEKLLPKAPDNSEEIRAEQERLNEISQNLIKEFNENPYTKEVLSKNAITIGDGNDKFTFPIDAKEIADLVINGDKTGDLMFEKVTKNGQESFVPRTQHQLLVATVNKYGEKFITELAKHYKSLGGKAAIDPIENARPKDSKMTSTASAEPTTLAGAMAKYGRLNSGGW